MLPKLIAHRGASIYAPENTLAALRRAAELGATWVECDIALSACGEAVIIHDDRLDRTTSGSGLVAETRFETIRQLDAGSWFSPEFAHEPIPSLDEWLSCAAAFNLGLNLELKVPATSAELVVEKLLQSLERYWPHGYSRLLISSFVHENLDRVRQADSKLPIALLMHAWSDEYASRLKSLNCASINLSYKSLTEEMVKKIATYELPILAYTVDDKEIAECLFDWGVTGVFSNDPCLLGDAIR
jgi:glycerophosphoryl diester phosphodiesterase